MFSRRFSAGLAALAWLVWAAAATGADAQPKAPGSPTPAPTAHSPPTAPHGASAGASPGAAGHEKKEIKPLDFQTDLALWTGAVFLVFFAILWKFAWKPIAQGLDKRERHVADEISQAQAANEEARRLLAEHQAKLAASGAEVREMLDQGRRDTEILGRQILQKAKADTELEKQRALREIEAATDGAVKDLAERSATLAVELAGKLLQAKLDPKAHTRLIEQAVAGFSKMAPSKN